MALRKTAFKTVSHMGSPLDAVGTTLALHSYVSNDDAATVETAGYFNGVASRLKKGDRIMCSLNLAGVPAFKSYGVVSVTGGVVTIAAVTS